MAEASRHPLSEDHRLLGEYLRSARKKAGITTRDVGNYSSGHVSNMENGHVTPSRELVDHYIAAYGCERGHALRLYSRVQAWGSQRRREAAAGGATPPQPPSVTNGSPLADIRSCYQIQEAETYYRLDGAGVIRSVNVIRRISALYPGVDLVSAHFMYYSDVRARFVIEAVSGCQVVDHRKTSDGDLVAVLRLSRKINPSDSLSYSFAYTIGVESDIQSRPVIRYFGQPFMSRYAIRIQFHENAFPGRIWRFRGPDSAAPAYDPEPDSVLDLSPSGFYCCDFFNVSYEYLGLRWDWI